MSEDRGIRLTDATVRKKTLENDIKDLLGAFTAETDLRVRDINLSTTTISKDGEVIDFWYKVDVEVTL